MGSTRSKIAGEGLTKKHTFDWLGLRETETKRNTNTENQASGTTVDTSFKKDFKNESGFACVTFLYSVTVWGYCRGGC